MFQNFFKIAIRTIMRQKAYALINIMGLAIGLATSILILLFVLFETSFDNFHENAGQIYRLTIEGRLADTELSGANSAIVSAPVFYDEIPEVVNYTRLDAWGNVLIRHEGRSYMEDNFFWADTGFFEIFSFPLIYGDPSTALSQPRSMVISQKASEKYFGEENPMGKVLYVFGDSTVYTITGLMQDNPENSHITCDFVVDFKSSYRIDQTNWTSNNVYSYLLVQEGFSHEELEAKMNGITRKYVAPEIQQFLGTSLEDWEKAGNYYNIRAQPLLDIHLNSDISDQVKAPSDKKYIYIFTLVALFIISIACINFMNLSTARSAGRAREVGLRKVVGSGKGLLIRQFLAESFVMVIIALMIALLAIELVLPAFNRQTQLNLSMDLFGHWYTLPGLVVFALFVGLMAGSYPAFFLASFKPVSVLSGKLEAGAKSGRLRSILVVVQFVISIFIILGTLVITRQLNYMMNKDLGFQKEQIVVLERAGSVGWRRIESFKQEIARIPGVVASTSSTIVPGHITNYNGHLIEGRPAEQTFLLHVNYTDYDFPATYGFEITQGRFASSEYPSDSGGIVINEAALKNFNIQDPLQCVFLKPGETTDEMVRLPVIGVMKDVHMESMHSEILPYMMCSRKEYPNWIPYLSIRLEPGKTQDVLKQIEGVWDEFTTGQPFLYFFLDDDFNRNYRQEARTRFIFIIFSVFAIAVACLGLLGLTSFTTEQRTREIGIRKAMGASAGTIVRLISREIVILIGIATLIAWPAAWFFTRDWLNDFAYRTELSVMPFLVSFVIAMLIALITIAIQVVSAALRNPADSLRHE